MKNNIHLSILIPCYNWDVFKLITNLHNLCNQETQLDKFEILCIEDASTKCFSNKNISQLNHVIYKKLEHNIGRSKIRNLMIEKAKYEWLLFIDADSKIATKKFITNYIKLIPNSKKEIYYGSTIYSEEPPEHAKLLHWKYGKEIESKRKKYIFSSHHFLIKKELFNHSIGFNENINSYGYEDVLFILENKLDPIYIENPLYHIGLKKNHDFIKDVECALTNLMNFTNSIGQTANRIRISQISQIISKIYLNNFIILLFQIFKKIILNNMKSKNPSIYLLQFYKLGYFLEKKNMNLKKL